MSMKDKYNKWFEKHLEEQINFCKHLDMPLSQEEIDSLMRRHKLDYYFYFWKAGYLARKREE